MSALNSSLKVTNSRGEMRLAHEKVRRTKSKRYGGRCNAWDTDLKLKEDDLSARNEGNLIVSRRTPT